MKKRIGLLPIGEEPDMYKRMTESICINEKEYDLVSVETEEILSTLDGIVIYVANQEKLEMMSWLIELEHQMPLFIWIVYSKPNEQIAQICYELCKHSVITIIDQPHQLSIMKYMIRNAMNYKKSTTERHCAEIKKNQYNFSLDASKMILVYEDSIIRLTRREFMLTSLLFEQMNNVVSYERLEEHLFGKTGSYYQARLANLVHLIREKLKVQNYLSIEIIRTKGYMLCTNE